MFVALFLVLASFHVAVGHFSISYLSSAEERTIHNAGTIFVDSPDRAHVADICARLGGFEPILKSGKCFMDVLLPETFSRITSFNIEDQSTPFIGCTNLILLPLFCIADYDKLPVFDLFSGKPSEKAIVLELHGGSVPEGALTIVHSGNAKAIEGPRLSDVMTVLKDHAIKLDSKSLTMDGESDSQVQVSVCL